MMKEWFAAAIVLIVGAALMSGISSLGGGQRFGPAFVYALVGLATVALAMTGTIVAYFELGRRGKVEESDGRSVLVALFGMFVVVPIALLVVFKVLHMPMKCC
jgi:hypothetical protein